MASYHRKLSLAEKIGPDKKPDDDNKYESDCYCCIHDCSQSVPPSSPKHQISTILILSLCILGVSFLFLSYFAIRRCRSRRRTSPPLENNDIVSEVIMDELNGPVIDHPIWYIRTVGLPQSMIDSIEVFKYKRGEGLMEGSDCSVCLSEFLEDERLRLLPKCSHAFHVSCIDAWLRSHKNCPVCRAPVMIGSASEVSSEETSSSDSESTEESDVESEDESGEIRGSELGVEDEKVGEVSSKGNGRLRVMSDLVDHRMKVDQELERARRSISMDFSSASAIYDL